MAGPKGSLSAPSCLTLQKMVSPLSYTSKWGQGFVGFVLLLVVGCNVNNNASKLKISGLWLWPQPLAPHLWVTHPW